LHTKTICWWFSLNEREAPISNNGIPVPLYIVFVCVSEIGERRKGKSETGLKVTKLLKSNFVRFLLLFDALENQLLIENRLKKISLVFKPLRL
jgi:hypothetical protein